MAGQLHGSQYVSLTKFCDVFRTGRNSLRMFLQANKKLPEDGIAIFDYPFESESLVDTFYYPVVQFSQAFASQYHISRSFLLEKHLCFFYSECFNNVLESPVFMCEIYYFPSVFKNEFSRLWRSNTHEEVNAGKTNITDYYYPFTRYPAVLGDYPTSNCSESARIVHVEILDENMKLAEPGEERCLPQMIDKSKFSNEFDKWSGLLKNVGTMLVFHNRGYDVMQYNTDNTTPQFFDVPQFIHSGVLETPLRLPHWCPIVEFSDKLDEISAEFKTLWEWMQKYPLQEKSELRPPCQEYKLRVTDYDDCRYMIYCDFDVQMARDIVWRLDTPFKIRERFVFMLTTIGTAEKPTYYRIFESVKIFDHKDDTTTPFCTEASDLARAKKSLMTEQHIACRFTMKAGTPIFIGSIVACETPEIFDFSVQRKNINSCRYEFPCKVFRKTLIKPMIDFSSEQVMTALKRNIWVFPKTNVHLKEPEKMSRLFLWDYLDAVSRADMADADNEMGDFYFIVFADFKFDQDSGYSFRERGRVYPPISADKILELDRNVKYRTSNKAFQLPHAKTEYFGNFAISEIPLHGVDKNEPKKFAREIPRHGQIFCQVLAHLKKEGYEYIAVDGNIGSGKSMLLDCAFHVLNTWTATEPLDTFRNLLALKKFDERFQPMITKVCLENISNVANLKYLVDGSFGVSNKRKHKQMLIERSPLAHDLVFKRPDNPSFPHASIAFDTKRFALIYLDMSVDTCFDRMTKRARTGEEDFEKPGFAELETRFKKVAKIYEELGFLVLDCDENYCFTRRKIQPASSKLETLNPQYGMCQYGMYF